MDPFALLTGGVKFDKKRFAKDINVFQPQVSQAHTAPQGSIPVQARASSHRKHKNKRQKLGHQEPQATKQADTSGINIFGASLTISNQDKHSQHNEINSQHAGSPESETSSNDCSQEELDVYEHQSDLGEEETEEDASDDLENIRTHQERQSNGQHTGHDRNGTPNQGLQADLDMDPGCPRVSTRDAQEAANVVRKHYRIKVAGRDAPAPLRSWQELATRVALQNEALKSTAGSSAEEETQHAQRAAENLVKRLKGEGGWAQPSPIQRQAVPCLLSGRELLAVAPTGSGKTLSFLVPLLLKLKSISRVEGKAGEGGPAGPRALLLTPTHELAAQQARVLRIMLPGSGLKAALLTKATAVDNSFRKTDILLANPLRLATLAAAGQVDLRQVRYLILDEADKLFEMGFVQQIDAIVAACCHKDITRALFSATLPDKVEQLARSVLTDPLRVTVGVRNTAVSSVKQRLLFVGKEAGKVMALRQLLAEGLPPPVLVFVSTKERAKVLHRELLYDGVRVDSINAAQTATQRAAAVDNFSGCEVWNACRAGRTWVLIATDLIGRGMDFIGVRTVVNFDFPSSTTDYIHRVGRTGRASQTGEAITFFTEEDAPSLRPIANIIKEAGGEVPDWMLMMKKQSSKDRKKRRLSDAVARGATISTQPLPRDRHKSFKKGNRTAGQPRKAKQTENE